jgi:CelD/BcsL family acetyltransferase involved in cellulose biosynthesis
VSAVAVPVRARSSALRPPVRVARTLEEVEALRPIWEAVPAANPEADIDLFAAVTATAPGLLRPHVIVVERENRTPAMAIARVEVRALEAKVGYRTLARPRVKVLSVVHSGIAGAEDQDTRRLLLAELRRPLREREADVLCISKLRTDSPLFALARATGSWPCRDHLRAEMPRTDVAVPDDLDAFLRARSRNTRDNCRRYSRKLEREYGDALSVTAYRTPAELPGALEAMELVAQRTYQRALGVGFRDEPHQRALLEAAARKDLFRAWVLRVGETPIAFWHGIAYRGTFYIGSPGYDPGHAKVKVGQYLQLRMMEDLCAEPMVERLDYGFGDAQYKRSFGDTTWTEADVLIFAPRVRALGANALRTGIGVSTRAAKHALGAERVAALRRRGRRARLVAS